MPCFQRVEIAIERESGESYWQYVPCGQCLGCRNEQARQWAVRMVHESTQHARSWFMTLTYDNESLPEKGSLSAEHCRAFVRRLRRYYYEQQRRKYYVQGRWLPGRPRTFSYYLCGEYGPLTLRPHYHAVCYGADFPDRDYERGSGRSVVWKSQILNELWRHGITEFSAVTMGSASYVAQYVRKKLDERNAGLVKLYDEDGAPFNHPKIYTRVDASTGELVAVTPEFSRMSRRPAIGRRWIEKYWRDVYPRDFVVVNGHESKPPRYYDKWCEVNQPEVWKEVRKKRLEEYLEDRLSDAREYPVVEDLEKRVRYRENAGFMKADGRRKLFQSRSSL